MGDFQAQSELYDKRVAKLTRDKLLDIMGDKNEALQKEIESVRGAMFYQRNETAAYMRDCEDERLERERAERLLLEMKRERDYLIKTLERASKRVHELEEQAVRWEAMYEGALAELHSWQNENLEESNMKIFTMYRRDVPDETHNEKQKNPPDEPQFEGVVFTDGSVAIRWRTAVHCTSVWDSMDDMLKIHGHPEYGSELVWHL
jgi:hypothetical protein